MNLPQLTALIGEEERKRRASESELAMLVQPLEASEGKQSYLCFLTFDLSEEEIRLEDLRPFDKEHLYIYNYFGNNTAASLQYYVTRKADSLHYLLLSCLSDLALALERNKLTDGELYKLLLQLDKRGMIELKSKKGKGKVNLGKIKGINTENWSIQKDKQKVKIIVGDKTYTSETFARHLLQIETSANNELTIVIPRIKTNENQSPIIISQHPDYISVTKKEQKLESSKKKQKRLCFICQEEREDTSSSVTAKFNRSGINKIFTTTTINAARNLNKNNYDDNYAICGDCFQNLLFGERVISSKFQARIAGERAIILPEALFGHFYYEYLYGIKKSVDLAFSPINFEDWKNQLDVEKDEIIHNPGYIVHFVIYRTDGNSISIIDTFEDVQLSRISKVFNLLGNNAAKLPSIHSFSLGTIYRIIPVRTEQRSGEQLDIQRVLSVYKALLANHILEADLLYQYAMEALEKGLSQIRKKKIIQYQNLLLNRYIPDKEDYYIKDIVMKYLCLLRTCQDLCALDKIPFSNRKVEKNNMCQNLQDETIAAIEAFLTEQNFDHLSRALFYLGTLINLVGRAQSGKGHKSKPILGKIHFQGMNSREVIWLYQEVLEKLRQYDQMKYPLTERLLSQFHHYYGVLKTNEELSEQANVFYIMSGYAYMTGVSLVKSSRKDDVQSNDNNTDTGFDTDIEN